MISYRLWPCVDPMGDKELALYNWLVTLDTNSFYMGAKEINFENEDDALTFVLKFGIYTGKIK